MSTSGIGTSHRQQACKRAFIQTCAMPVSAGDACSEHAVALYAVFTQQCYHQDQITIHVLRICPKTPLWFLDEKLNRKQFKYSYSAMYRSLSTVPVYRHLPCRTWRVANRDAALGSLLHLDVVVAHSVVAVHGKAGAQETRGEARVKAGWARVCMIVRRVGFLRPECGYSPQRSCCAWQARNRVRAWVVKAGLRV